MKKIWESIKRGVLMFWVSTWYVWAAVLLAALAGWIFGWNVSIWVFFGIVGGVIAFVFLRQIWWFISGTGDYSGREGLLLRLYKKVFKK